MILKHWVSTFKRYQIYLLKETIKEDNQFKKRVDYVFVEFKVEDEKKYHIKIGKRFKIKD